jgi:hypothetical protein
VAERCAAVQIRVVFQHENPTHRSLVMAARKQFQSDLPISSELQQLLEDARNKEVSEDELHEQRISFAFGNALHQSQLITKESVRRASQNIRLK